MPSQESEIFATSKEVSMRALKVPSVALLLAVLTLLGCEKSRTR